MDHWVNNSQTTNLNMKKLLPAIWLLLLSLTAFGQIPPDTLTPEKKARHKINIIRGTKITALPNYAISNALRDITNLSAIKMSYVTPAQLRAGRSDTARVVYIMDGLRSGIFVYDATNTTAADDSSMCLRYGARRYFRDAGNVIRPEWFGANPKDTLDDYIPMQKALNAVGNFGAEYQLSEGEYFVRAGGLKAKKIDPNNSNQPRRFRLTIRGKGKGTTRVTGGEYGGIIGKNLLEFPYKVGDDPAWNDSDVLIEGITFHAGKADRCLYVNRVVNIHLERCTFLRGEIECVKLGNGDDGNNFAGYVNGCYFNGTTANGGQNGGCLNFNFRYGEITSNVSDGGKYALFGALDQCYIAGNTFEGSKLAGIYSSANGGGALKIIGNTIRPYGGFDPNGVFQGIQHGLHLNAVSGGMASNVISGNQIFIDDPANLDMVVIASSTAPPLVASPHAPYAVTGGTSGTLGQIVGINTTTGTILLQKNSGSGFVSGETLTQAITGGTFTITSILTNSGYALNLTGNAGYSTITGNRLTGGTAVVNVESPGNIFSNNVISGIRDGIFIGSAAGDTQVSDNYISLFSGSGSHKAVKRTGTPVVKFSDNLYGTATLDNIAPQKLSDISTTNRDALTSGQKYSGLLLNDVTVNKLTHWNGSAWSYLGPDRFISMPAETVSGNNIRSAGVRTYSNIPNMLYPYGAMLTFIGNSTTGEATANSTYINQIIATTAGDLSFRYSVNDWNTFSTNYRIWTAKDFTQIAAQTDVAALTSANAVGSPTQAEYDALRADLVATRTVLNALIAKMRTSKILTP